MGRKAIALLLPPLCICLLGCGTESWQADTFPAQGRVMVNGEPAVGAVVELHSVGNQPDERNSRPWAIVGEDGRYSMSTYETGDGAPVGEYAITLRWPPDVNSASLADRFNAAYTTPAKSQWRASIVEGDNGLPLIDLQNVSLAEFAEDAATAETPAAMPPQGQRSR